MGRLEAAQIMRLREEGKTFTSIASIFFGTEDILSDPKKVADIGILNLRKIRNIGVKSLREIVLALHSLGYIEFDEIANWFAGIHSGSEEQGKAARSEIRENKPCKSALNISPHLGEMLLQRYGDRIMEGFENLTNFALIDELKKP